MALAETAKLVASLELKDNLSKGLKSAEQSLGRLDGKIGTLGKQGLRNLGTNLARIGAVAAVGIGAAIKSGLDSLAELESVTAQTDAALKSTGGAAKVTAADVRELSESLEDLTTIDDKVIQSAANMMLTFTNVRNEVGEGNDIFSQSVEVLADMSTALGTDMSQSAIQLGKALNDPVAGMTALKRVGVTFNDDQKKLIKTLVEEGDVLGAQKVILAELNKEFGGSAAAQADTYAGKMRRLGDAVEGLQMALAEALLPVLTEVSGELNTLLRDEKVMTSVREFGKDLALGFKSLIGIAKNLPWAQIGQSLQLAGAGAKAVLGAFVSLPPWVQTAVLTGWGLNKLTGGALGGIVGELGKGLIKGVLGMNAGVVNINAATVRGGGLPVGGKGGALPAAGGAGVLSAVLAPASVAAIGAAVAVGLFNVIPAMFRGPKGSSGVTTKTITRESASRGTEAVWNTIAANTNNIYTATKALGPDLEEVNATTGFALGDLRRVTAAGDDRTAARIDSLNRATASGLGKTTTAANATAAAVRNKDWSPTINNHVGVTIPISVRNVTGAQRVVASYNPPTMSGKKP